MSTDHYTCALILVINPRTLHVANLFTTDYICDPLPIHVNERFLWILSNSSPTWSYYCSTI